MSAASGDSGGAQGGLAVALTSALRDCGGLWFGWSGEVTDAFTGQINFKRENGVTTATVDLEEQDVDEYYNGYANRTLWPLFHYRIDLAEYERDFAGGYQRANERFADTVRPLIEPADAVWIQDYHMRWARSCGNAAAKTASASSSTRRGPRGACWSPSRMPPASCGACSRTT